LTPFQESSIKHDTSPSLRCSRKKRMTTKNFMKLIISI
jgi:hypothetical protein